MINAIIAFVGKQDPIGSRGQLGPLLSAVMQLPFKPDAALLLYCEGASDRADGKDESLAEGFQQLRTEEVAEELRQRFTGIEITSVELKANPSHAGDLLQALRKIEHVQTLRHQWRKEAVVHVLIAGGTPAMRELLTALHVSQSFGRMQGWYASDREGIRQEIPLATQAVYLTGVVQAVRLGEYALAELQLRDVNHIEADSAKQLLQALAAYQDGDYSKAQQLLAGWKSPDNLQVWRKEALNTLKHLRQTFGEMLTLWNDVQQGSARNAVLSYATLLERSLQLLAENQGISLRNPEIADIVSRLPMKGVAVPDELDGTQGEPRRLYRLRNEAIRTAAGISASDGQAARTAATALLASFPGERDEVFFLRQPEKNAFSPTRREELAQALADWLTH